MRRRDIVKKQSPSEAQKSYGNYKKLHILWNGLRISVENPRGSRRSGKDKNGSEWSRTLTHDYGYVRGSEGKDGDHVDVFLSPKYRSAKNVHIIDQLDPETGKFDEHKVMIGFDTQDSARRAYMENYQRGWKGCGDITTMSVPAFKIWVFSPKSKSPVSPVVKRAYVALYEMFAVK
jgi:hypothetical protein